MCFLISKYVDSMKKKHADDFDILRKDT